ncbi:MAG: zf-HC2 domain-containing protein [Gaiellaceae bacterium]
MRRVLEEVIPERCERSRESISLELDGMLSRFERALLERHLRSCASCRAFAVDVRAQTAQLRAAPLEAPPVLADIPPARVRTAGRRAAGFAGAVAVSVVAALISFAPVGDQRTAAMAQTPPNSALLAVVPAAPTANATFEVGRLRLVSAASADGPVRGLYGVPA